MTGMRPDRSGTPVQAGIRAWEQEIRTYAYCGQGRAQNLLLHRMNAVPVHRTTIIIRKSDREFVIMKTLVEVHQEGRYFVAVDLLSNLADQGLSEEEALKNLRRGLEEHYRILLELAPQDHKLEYLEFEVDAHVGNSPAAIT
jgi:predicted RNase H-like HicB family nuclease